MTSHVRLPAALLGPTCLLAALSGCSRQTPAVGTAPLAAPVVRAQAPAEQQERPRAPAAKKGAPQPKEAAAASPFAQDRGAKLVAERLTPSDAALAEEARQAAGPRPLAAPPALESPQFALPRYTRAAPRPATRPKGNPLRPGPLAERPPLDEYRADPLAPRRPEFPKAGLIRLPAPDLNQPVPLPILATPRADGAPLTDPTAEVSLAALLAAPIPVRTTPAPFVRLNLPDPFEHAQTVRLHTTPDEDPTPPVAVLRTPSR